MKSPATLILAIALLLPARANAQLPRDARPWSFQIGAGYSAPQGIVDELFDAGFTIVGGATYHPIGAPVLGLWVEGNYNGYDVTQEALDAIGVANGDLRMWSVTGGIGLEVKGKVGFYFALGTGWYRRQIDLVNPTRPVLGVACNPWWDFCAPVQLVIEQNVVGSRTTNGFGYNGGLGLTFRLASGSQIYVEAKYHYIPADVEPIELIPVVVGYRW